MTLKVGIIGGGCAGLACATELIKKGVSVTILEKNNSLGGLAAGFRESNWKSSLEYFYHHWFQSDAFLKEYSKTWEVEKNIVFKRPLTVMETNAKITHEKAANANSSARDASQFVQLDSPISLLLYPNLSFFNKIRMSCALAYIKMQPNWHALERVTAQAWCERYMGKTGFNELWLPLLQGKFGEKWAREVNMAWFWSRLACRTPELGTYRGGFQKFFDDVEVWLRKNSVSIHKEQNEISVSFENNVWIVKSSGNTFEFDKLVIAAGPGAFASLCKKVAPNYATQVSRRNSLGAHVAIFSLKKNVGNAYWYNLRKNSSKPFIALIEHTNFVSREEYDGEHIVYLADYLDTSSVGWQRSDADTIALALKTIQSVNPNISSDDVIRARVFRDAYAQPVVGVNASKNIPPMRIAEASNLFHGSMDHVYPWDRGTNFAFELGKNLANEVLL